MNTQKKQLLKAFKIKIFENETIIEPSNGKSHVTIIWLHGMEMKPIDLLKMFVKGNSLRLPDVRIVLPQAPKITVTIDGRAGISSWYDVFDRSTFQKPLEELVDVKQIRNNLAVLDKVVEREIQFLDGDSKRLFVCGNSQGAAMAMTLGLQAKHQLGGILVVSGYFFNITEINEKNLDTLLYSFNGKKDILVPWELAKVTYEDLLNRKPVNTKLVLNDAGHEFDQEVVREKLAEIIDNSQKI